MKRFINIMLMLILVCSAVIYVAKMTYQNQVYVSLDAVYNENVNSNIEDALAATQKNNDILAQNDIANQNTKFNSGTASGGAQGNITVQTDPYKVLSFATQKYNNQRNLEVKRDGVLHAGVSAGPLSITMDGTPSFLIQRNARGEQYYCMKIYDLVFPKAFAVNNAEVENIYYYNGSQYVCRQFREYRNYTTSSFLREYTRGLTDFYYDFNENTTNITNFVYDPKTEKYTIGFSLKQSNTSTVKGAETLRSYLNAMFNNKSIDNLNVWVPKVNGTIIIAKDYRFVNMYTYETWCGSLGYSIVGNIRASLDLTFATTFNYKSAYFKTQTVIL